MQSVYRCAIFLLSTVFLWQYGCLLVQGKAPKLGTYKVDKNLISVSGLSSGGFMAVQFHVAFSKAIMGAGVVAGGPFWCAEGNPLIALSSCTKTPYLISVSKLVAITYSTALSNTIDSPSNLKNDRVFLFSGSLDSVINPGVVKKLAEYYSSFLTTGSLAVEYSIPAEHAMVTDDFGNKCYMLASPYINNCNYLTAFYILQHIYMNVHPADTSSAKTENLLEFDQSEFFANLPEIVSMDSTGFVYVPTACQNKTRVCRLHIAFHGCLQGRKFVSDQFALHAGYNGLAETNEIIILYPQVQYSPLNPTGCWDW